MWRSNSSHGADFTPFTVRNTGIHSVTTLQGTILEQFQATINWPKVLDAVHLHERAQLAGL